jgi:hypothetical protein
VDRLAVVALTRILLLPLVVGAAGASASGCWTTSLIETRQGQRVEARIVGGSPGSVYLAGDQHERFTIRRDDIADVDFPGNVLMVGGIALTGFGAYRMLEGDTSCGGLGQSGNCLASVAPGIIGLLAFGWGLYTYWRANHAFEDRSRPEPDPPMKPRGPAPVPPLPGARPPGWSKPDPFAEPRP